MVLTNEMLADKAEHIKMEITDIVRTGSIQDGLNKHKIHKICILEDITEYKELPPEQRTTLEPRIFDDMLSSGRDLQNMYIERTGNINLGLRNVLASVDRCSNFNSCEWGD